MSVSFSEEAEFEEDANGIEDGRPFGTRHGIGGCRGKAYQGHHCLAVASGGWQSRQKKQLARAISLANCAPFADPGQPLFQYFSQPRMPRGLIGE